MRISVLTIVNQFSVKHDPDLTEDEVNTWLMQWASKVTKEHNADGAYIKTFSFDDPDNYGGLADFEWKPDGDIH